MKVVISVLLAMLILVIMPEVAQAGNPEVACQKNECLMVAEFEGDIWLHWYTDGLYTIDEIETPCIVDVILGYGEAHFPDVSKYNDDGTFVVVWQQRKDIVYRLVSRKAQTDSILLQKGNIVEGDMLPRVACYGDDCTFVWQTLEDGGYHVHVYDGDTIGMLCLGYGENPEVTRVRETEFLITYVGEQGIESYLLPDYTNVYNLYMPLVAKGSVK